MSPIELLVGVVFVLCVGPGLGLGAMGDASSIEYLVARICFAVGALALSGAYFYWFSEGDRSARAVVLVGTIVGLYIFVALPLEFMWLAARAEKVTANT